MNDDQREAWRRALAASKRQQRTQRSRRKTGLATVARAGMLRIQPRRGDDDQDQEDPVTPIRVRVRRLLGTPLSPVTDTRPGRCTRVTILGRCRATRVYGAPFCAAHLPARPA